MSKCYTDEQLMQLAKDPDFQARFATDHELDELCAENQRSVDDRLLEVGLAFGGAAALNDAVSIKAPTPGALLLLGTLNSPYMSAKDRRLIDVDIAFYILGMGKDALYEGDFTEEDFSIRASNCTAKLGFDREAVDGVITKLIIDSFRAFDLIPKNPGEVGKQAPQPFDLAWYAWITSVVACATGIPADTIGWEMPVALCMHYVVADKRKKGLKVLDQTPKEKIFDRTNEIMNQWLTQKG